MNKMGMVSSSGGDDLTPPINVEDDSDSDIDTSDGDLGNIRISEMEQENDTETDAAAGIISSEDLFRDNNFGSLQMEISDARSQDTSSSIRRTNSNSIASSSSSEPSQVQKQNTSAEAPEHEFLKPRPPGPKSKSRPPLNSKSGVNSPGSNVPHKKTTSSKEENYTPAPDPLRKKPGPRSKTCPSPSFGVLVPSTIGKNARFDDKTDGTATSAASEHEFIKHKRPGPKSKTMSSPSASISSSEPPSSSSRAGVEKVMKKKTAGNKAKETIPSIKSRLRSAGQEKKTKNVEQQPLQSSTSKSKSTSKQKEEDTSPEARRGRASENYNRTINRTNIRQKFKGA